MRDEADKITWVLIADGEKALILKNTDTDANPLLDVIVAQEIDNPPTHEQGANRPGRMNDGRAGGVRRSAFDQADWHELGKADFSRKLVERLNAAAKRGAFDRLVVFAPPQTLGRLRPDYHHELKTRLVTEVASDLTGHPVNEIELQVAKALSG